MSELDPQQGDAEAVTCQVCNQTLPSAEDLLEHMRETHPEERLGEEGA